MVELLGMLYILCMFILATHAVFDIYLSIVMKLIHLLECHYAGKPKQPPGGGGPALLLLLVGFVRECLTQLDIHNLMH